MANIITRDTHDTSRLVKMAPRAERRARQGKSFRPVYHHGIPTKIPHKAIIAAMKIHKHGRRAAQAWQPKLNTANACVSFGLAVKLFLANLAVENMKARHAELKATGKWVTCTT